VNGGKSFRREGCDDFVGEVIGCWDLFYDESNLALVFGHVGVKPLASISDNGGDRSMIIYVVPLYGHAKACMLTEILCCRPVVMLASSRRSSAGSLGRSIEIAGATGRGDGQPSGPDRGAGVLVLGAVPVVGAAKEERRPED